MGDIIHDIDQKLYPFYGGYPCENPPCQDRSAWTFYQGYCRSCGLSRGAAWLVLGNQKKKIERKFRLKLMKGFYQVLKNILLTQNYEM